MLPRSIRTIQQFLLEEEAATAVEYAVVLMLIAGVCIAAIQFVGGGAAGFWDHSVEEIDNALK